jgi:DNA replication protein DnaC
MTIKPPNQGGIMHRNRTNDVVYSNMLKYNISPKMIQMHKNNSIQTQKYKDKSLFIYGKAGTGKTTLAISIVFDVLKNTKNPLTRNAVSFFQFSDMLLELKSYYTKNKADPKHGIEYDENAQCYTTFEERLMNKHKQANYLIIDDLGIGKTTDWGDELLYSIINHRYNHLHGKTIITSNVSPQSLTKKIWERTTSRIIDMCELRRLTNQYRKT